MNKIKAFLKHPIFWGSIAFFLCLYLLMCCISSTINNIEKSGGLKNIIQPLWDGKQNEVEGHSKTRVED